MEDWKSGGEGTRSGERNEMRSRYGGPKEERRGCHRDRRGGTRRQVDKERLCETQRGQDAASSDKDPVRRQCEEDISLNEMSRKDKKKQSKRKKKIMVAEPEGN